MTTVKTLNMLIFFIFLFVIFSHTSLASIGKSSKTKRRNVIVLVHSNKHTEVKDLENEILNLALTDKNLHFITDLYLETHDNLSDDQKQSIENFVDKKDIIGLVNYLLILNPKEVYKKEALHFALQRKNIDLADVVINLCPNPEERKQWIEEELENAIKAKDKNVATFILEMFPVDDPLTEKAKGLGLKIDTAPFPYDYLKSTRDSSRLNTLHFSYNFILKLMLNDIKEKPHFVLLKILDHFKRVHEREFDTVFKYAIQYGSIDVVKALDKLIPDSRLLKYDGLLEAVRYGKVDAVTYLLTALNFDPETLSQSQKRQIFSAMLLAVKNNQYNVFYCLIKKFSYLTDKINEINKIINSISNEEDLHFQKLGIFDKNNVLTRSDQERLKNFSNKITKNAGLCNEISQKVSQRASQINIQ